MTSHCRSCGAEIRWGETIRGRRMPLDVEPTADGTLVLDERGRITVALLGAAGDAPRYRSHFATCPHADQHRRGA